MTQQQNSFAVRSGVAAVRAALLAIASVAGAQAAEPTVADLTQPLSSVEVGVVNVDKGVYKFGEYNGLERKGTTMNADIDFRGGAAYDSEGGSRFRLSGRNLGLENRNLSGEFAEPGTFRFTFGYDELLRNRSDSYMSPYQGAGGAALTLPANWATNAKNCSVATGSSGNTNFGGVSNATAGTSGCGNYYLNQSAASGNLSATPVGNALALTSAELGDFSQVKLATKRVKTSAGLSFLVNSAWQFSASGWHETKDGIQPMGIPFVTTNAQVTIPYPIHYETNQVRWDVTFTGKDLTGQLSYTLSEFKNGFNSVMVQDPYFSSLTPTLSSTGAASFTFPDFGRLGEAPANQLHQVNFAGGYEISRQSKITVNASFGHNVQNQSFLPAGTGIQEAQPLPVASLNGVVSTRHIDIRFTSRVLDSLRVGVGVKTDERNNQTASNLYNFRDTDQQVAGTNSTFYNLPYSRKTSVAAADADWSFARGQSLKLGYEHQHLQRYCDNVPPSSVFPGLANGCVNATDFSEDTGRIDYRNRMLDSLTVRVGYAYSDRTAGSYQADVAEYAQDLLTRFNMTSRKRDKVRTSVDWQATEAVDFTLSFDSNEDRYGLGRNPGALGQNLGLQNERSNAWNLDASWQIAESASAHAFLTQEDARSKLLGNACTSLSTSTSALSCSTASTVGPVSLSNWSADMHDKVTTTGIGAKWGDLMNHKLDLAADLLTSRANSPYSLGAASGLAFSSSATSGTNQTLVNGASSGFPDVHVRSNELHLGVKYALGKNSALHLTFIGQQFHSADPVTYTGLQQGSATAQVSGSATAKVNGVALPVGSVYPVSALMPTNEQAPDYTVHVIGISYAYTFR